MQIKQRINSDYVKNSLKLILGTLFAQILPFVFYPILGRLFLPSDFTLLANFTAIVSIISVLVSCQYRQMILIAGAEKNATNVFILALILTVVGSIFCTSLLYVFVDDLVVLLGQPELDSLLYLIPLAVISLNVFELYNEWCVRHKFFGNLSLNKIVNSSSLAIIKTACGFFTIPAGLVVGDVVGRVISAFFCCVGMFKRKFKLRGIVSVTRMKYVARKYKECPFNLMPAQFLNTVGGQMPILILSSFFLSDHVGQFTMAYSIMALPAAVISLAIRDVFRQKANEMYVRYGNCREVYVSTIKVVSIISIVGFSFLAVISPWLFSFFWGDNWSLSGIYARILCPMVAINFVSEVGAGMFVISGHFKQGMYWQFAYVLLSVLSLLLGAIIFKSIIATIVCFSMVRTVLYFINFSLTYQYAKGVKIIG